MNQGNLMQQVVTLILLNAAVLVGMIYVVEARLQRRIHLLEARTPV